MSMSDPIADMLTRIRNANTAKHDTVDVPASKMKKKLASCRLAARFWHSFGNLKRNKATENRESVRLSPKI